MADAAVRRTEQGMKSAKHGQQQCPAKHARNVIESCGSIGSGGSRCDRVPHNDVIPHHCCGDGWEKAW